MIYLSERVVKVRLSAQVAEYQAGMLKAAQATRTVGSETEKLAQKRRAFEELGRVTLTTGGLMAAGIGVAIKKFADFDEAMSNVAATGQDARDNIVALRDAAIEAGARTVFSATESANAIEEMAKAGVDAKDILAGGLSGALDLAAAGGLGVADAAGIAAVALKTFKLEGSDMSHVADLLAAGAGKAMGDVSDLSQALSQGGQVAAATGLSIEETTAALAAFASQGLLGSDAGTSLKTMLQRLTPQSKEAADKFEALGISAYDANGQFVGLSNFAGQLRESMSSLTPEARNAAMSVMFGSDAVRAANVLYSEGWRGIEKWTAAVDDQGYAAETARTKLDNLKGDVEALGGAFDSAMITMGSAADGPLRFVVQGLTELVDTFNGLPEGAQQAVFWTGAVASAGSLALGTYLTLVPKVAEFKIALDELGPSAQKTASRVGALARMGAVATAIGVVTYGVDALSEAIAKGLLPSAEKIENQMRSARSGVELFATALNSEGIQNTQQASTLLASLADELDAVAGSDFWNPASTSGTAVTVANELAKIANSGDMALFSAQFRRLAEDAGLTERQMRTFIRANPDLENALIAQATKAGMASDAHSLLKVALGNATSESEEATKAAERQEAALREVAGQAEATGGEVDKLADSIRDFGSATLDVRGAQRDFEASIDDVKASLEKNGKSLDISTEKGRANESALDGVAKSALEYAAALYEQTGSQQKASDAISEGRERLIKLLERFGITGEAAEKYADKLGLIPENISTYVEAVVDPAAQAVDSFISKYTGKRITVYVDAAGGKTYSVQGSDIKYRADGGAITGPGGPKSDTIPAMLSPGEHVLTADDVDKMGGQSKVYEFRQALQNGDIEGFASGGAITLQKAKDAVARAQAKLRRASSKSARRKAQAELDEAREDLADVQRSFLEERTDWNTGQRRGENRRDGMNGNGLSLVDQLLDIAADTGGKRGKKLKEQALAQEKQYLKLEKQAKNAATALDDARTKLSNLRDSAKAMAEAVSSAIRRTFDVSAWKAESGTKAVTSSRMVDGVEVTTVTQQKSSTGLTADSIRKDATAKADAIKRFTLKLEELKKKGYNGGLLEEIASLGVENGEPIADALLTATQAEVDDINTQYKRAGDWSKRAGREVADANFGALIEQAEKARNDAKADAAAIRKKLETETTRIITRITDALTVNSGGKVKKSKGKTSKKKGAKKARGGPVYGPGTETSDSIPAWLSNNEHVWTAAEVKAAGGHSAVAAMRRAVLVPTAARYASGGPVVAGGGTQSGVDSRPPITFAPVVHNPHTRDVQRDLREQAQVFAALMSAPL